MTYQCFRSQPSGSTVNSLSCRERLWASVLVLKLPQTLCQIGLARPANVTHPAMPTPTSAVSSSLEGHTDAIGSDEYNQTLSEKRAESVRDYLVSSGVNINNVTAGGMGRQIR
jgi:hypothetical protein